MRYLLTLCIAILCMSMASVPETQKSRHEEAIALIQSTKGINVCGKEDSILKVLDRAIQLDSSLWDAYAQKEVVLALSNRLPEAFEMFKQLEYEGRFQNYVPLLCRLGDYYICLNDTIHGKEKFKQAEAVDEAFFAQQPSDSIVDELSYIYLHLYDREVTFDKCIELYANVPILDQKARSEAYKTLYRWVTLPKERIGPCADYYRDANLQKRFKVRTIQYHH